MVLVSTTSPPITTFAEISPSILSIAEAPNSEYAFPISISTGVLPLRVITGGVISGMAFTFTVLVTSVAAFPAAFQELYEGKNLGKMLLKLPAAD